MNPASARGLLPGLRGGDGDGDAGVEVDVAVTTRALFHDKARAVAESGLYAGGPELVFAVGFDTLARILDPVYYGRGRGALGTAGDDDDDEDDDEDEPTAAMRAALGSLFARAWLRVTTRPDDAWGTREEQLAYVRRLDAAWAGRVAVAADDGAAAGISSSRARAAARGAAAGDLEALVAGEVRALIEGEGLYR